MTDDSTTRPHDEAEDGTPGEGAFAGPVYAGPVSASTHLSASTGTGVSASDADQAQGAPEALPPSSARSETGYVLTRRDRTAITFVDWAVKLGTPEFQAHYRPVTDELFTHHFIDPTAKPAFVPPALVSVQQLDADSDPLEIIRSHVALVVDDREARDKARIETTAQFEESQRVLSELRAYVAGLEGDLAETTDKLQAADQQVAVLTGRLETEISGLHSRHAAELADTAAAHESTLAELTAERDTSVNELAAQRDQAIAELTAERDAEVGALRGQLETDSTAQRGEHEADIARLLGEHTAAVGALVAGHQSAVDEADARHAEAVAELETAHAEQIADLQQQLAASVTLVETTTAQLKEARLSTGSLTAQRDRAIAEGSEWRNRLQQTVAALATTIDVGEWSIDSSPDARLIEFVEQSQLALTSGLESARSTLDEIEEVATSQLVDESETSDYAIGANDAAVLILNALYGGAPDEGEEVDGEATAGGDSGSADAAGTTAASGEGGRGSVSDGVGIGGSDGTSPGNGSAAAVDGDDDAAARGADTVVVTTVMAGGVNGPRDGYRSGARPDGVSSVIRRRSTDDLDGLEAIESALADDDAVTLAEIEESDAEFEAGLGGEVDVEFENEPDRAAGRGNRGADTGAAAEARRAS
ncbi:hypothetical protein [Subtercola vilae]|uniref:Uncharacterized protein n=1 Tax=Subtercola vilae TaxID=2056433 RepID=A0A4T2BPX6_9MICO|nr:hypothetical protein [Subtercola vilae]TIH33310.1 hypothetical protein D4765_14975 [Subtercola vilae]